MPGRHTAEIVLQEFTEGDIPTLTEIMTRAFKDDAKRSRDKKRSGPEGHDDGSYLRCRGLEDADSTALKVLWRGFPVGACIIHHNPQGTSHLDCIFIDPTLQDQGLGTGVWWILEASYPSPAWEVTTPSWATRSQGFYEKKCGFIRVDRKEDRFFFRKERPN